MIRVADTGNRGSDVQVMIRYKVRPDEVERTIESLHAVYAEMESLRPAGLRDATYQLDDKVTFVAFVDVPDGPAVLQGLPEFQRFRAALDGLCDEPPVMTVLNEVGSYGLH